MPRTQTPFDSFLADVPAWIDSAWYVWIALAVTLVVIVVVVTVTKRRARARDRVPQYRRHDS